jgi:HAD superfamily hydrolase (TIGR01509 family)
VARPKPAPDVFLRAAELLRLRPADCCVIEDSTAGVEAALAAGMTVMNGA